MPTPVPLGANLRTDGGGFVTEGGMFGANWVVRLGFGVEVLKRSRAAAGGTETLLVGCRARPGDGLVMGTSEDLNLLFAGVEELF
jgi:hypothetical protein